MININNLDFSYNSSQKLFHKLTTDFTVGKIYGFLGRNGAGKTTLLKIICGLIIPNYGECRINNQLCFSRKAEILQNLFFIPETFYLPPITVSQYVESLQLFYPSFDRGFFTEKITALDLTMCKNLAKMSYGEKKRFMLIFGLATGAKIIIFDEPTNGLDIIAQSDIRKLLVESMTDEKLVIISTHHVREFENIFDRIMIIDNGNILLNEELSFLSDNIAVKLVPELPGQSADVLYQTQVPGGYSILTKSKHSEQKLDLEFFFKAVIEQSASITNYLAMQKENKND